MRVASVHSCVTEHILRSTLACAQSPTLSRLVDPRCPLAAPTPNVTYPGVQPVPCAIDACVRGQRHAKVSYRPYRRCVTIQRSPAPTVSIDGTRGALSCGHSKSLSPPQIIGLPRCAQLLPRKLRCRAPRARARRLHFATVRAGRYEFVPTCAPRSRAGSHLEAGGTVSARQERRATSVDRTPSDRRPTRCACALLPWYAILPSNRAPLPNPHCRTIYET